MASEPRRGEATCPLTPRDPSTEKRVTPKYDQGTRDRASEAFNLLTSRCRLYSNQPTDVLQALQACSSLMTGDSADTLRLDDIVDRAASVRGSSGLA